MRLSGSVTLAAALFTAAPALGAPVAGISWMSMCTADGAAMLPVPKESAPGNETAAACHAACILPRRNKRL